MALSDLKLFRLAKQQKDFKEAEKKAKADAATLSAQIIPELQRRGVKAIEGGGVRVNMVAGEETVYDLTAAKEVLKSSVYKQIVKEVPDTEAIAALISDGTIKPKTLAKFATQRPKAPYITVSYLKG